jgi:bis(5'-nucleosyl)-tetraphosphatase (symmetrical)
MSVYAIGDIQGCLDPLQRLLDVVRFDPAHDELWFVGDIVNRGPDSLKTLRFVKNLGACAVTVIGNHDMHLLVVAAGAAKKMRGDTIDDILHAPDRDELLDWLRRQKLMHIGHGYAMVHAGLLPQWSIEQALTLAREVEQALVRNDQAEFMSVMYGNRPNAWNCDLKGYDRLRVIVNAMTRMRLCTADGMMEFSHKIAPVNMPEGYTPWYDAPNRVNRNMPIIFGHWASLGVLLREDVIALDSGCVWGRKLTAIRLEGRRTFQCGCSGINGISA